MSIVPYEEPESPALTIKELIEEYRIAIQERDRFRMDNAAVLNAAQSHEEAVTDAKEALTACLAEAKLDYVQDGEFEVSLASQDRGHYDLAKLPAVVVDWPGVVMRVANKEAIKKLLKRKRNPLSEEERDQVANAWVENKTKPYIVVTRRAE